MVLVTTKNASISLCTFQEIWPGFGGFLKSKNIELFSYIQFESQRISTLPHSNVFPSLDYTQGKTEGMFATWYTFSTLGLRKHQEDNHDSSLVLFLVPKLVAGPRKEHQSLCWCVEQPHWWLRLSKLHQSKLSRDHFRALILRCCSWRSRGNHKQEVLHCRGCSPSGVRHVAPVWPWAKNCVTWLGLSFLNCQVEIIKHLLVYLDDQRGNPITAAYCCI